MKLARFGQAGNENSFGGVDEHGRETCESGTCLPGFEEVHSPAGADDSIGNSCKPCREGSQSSDGSPCSLCLPGTAAVASSAVCQRCEAGRFSATFGNSECGVCEAGTFAAAGSYTCTTCPPGSFSTSGSVNCTWCPAGFVAHDWGSLNCVACSAGTYAVAGGQLCNTCPECHFRSCLDTLQALRGYISCGLCGSRTTHLPSESAEPRVCWKLFHLPSCRLESPGISLLPAPH